MTLNRFGGKSVRTYLTILILGASAVLLLLLNLTVRAAFNDHNRVVIESTARLLHSSCDWAVAPLLASGKVDDISRLLENFGGDRHILIARVVGPNGGIIAKSGMEESKTAIPKLPLDALMDRRELIVAAWSDKGYFSATPIFGLDFSQERNSAVAAVFILGLSTETFVDGYQPFIALVDVVGIVSMVAYGVLLLYLVQRWFFLPLSIFSLAASKIREGDYTARVPVDTALEFRDHTEAFNSMAEKVASRQAELGQEVEFRAGQYQDTFKKLEQTKDALIR